MTGLKAYKFIRRDIREEDQRGDKFVERFLDGPQSVWDGLRARIQSVKQLWDVLTCPDQYLQFLKWIVGWTSELDSITKDLTPLQLRRLIDSSAEIWKTRGPEDSITTIFSFVPGTRSRIFNWFDFRWIVDETGLDEAMEDVDAWLIEVPGGLPPAENFMHLRIVDDGTLDRVLAKNLVSLMRATGERIELAYILFLDLFERDEDNSQWETYTASPMTVADGKMAVGAGHDAHVGVAGSDAWDDYAVWARIAVTAVNPAAGRKAGVKLYDQDADTYLLVSLDVDDNKISLWKYESGYTLVQSYAFDPWTELLLGSGTYYTIRAEIKNVDATDSHVKVYLDAEPYLDVVLADADFKDGTAGLLADGDSSLECATFEVYPIPMDTDLVDINS